MSPRTVLHLTTAFLLLALIQPTTVVASWAEATVTSSGVSQTAVSSSDAEASLDDSTVASPRQYHHNHHSYRIHHRRPIIIQVQAESAVAAGSVPQTKASPAAPQAPTSAVIQDPESVKQQLETTALPQAVAQAVADEAVPPAVNSQPLTASKSIGLLAFAAVGILGIDMVLLLMILFHRPRLARNQPIEKRF